MISESLKSARLMAGSSAYLQPSQLKIDSCSPRTSVVGPRPVDGSQPSCTAKIMISISPTQKVGSEKPRIDPAMMVFDTTLCGSQTRRTARAECPARPTSPSRGRPARASPACARGSLRAPAAPKTKELPRSPLSAPLRKPTYCSSTGLVEAERLGRALLFDLVGRRVDQDLDRIADQEEAAEHQHRRDEQHQQRLRQAAQDEDRHGLLLALAPLRCAKRVLVGARLVGQALLACPRCSLRSAAAPGPSARRPPFPRRDRA